MAVLSGGAFKKQKLLSVKFYSKQLTLLVSRMESKPPTVGFVITKKIGSAVTRNKIRRRLRVLSVELLSGKNGLCYIIIPQRTAVFSSFEELKRNLKFCINKSLKNNAYT